MIDINQVQRDFDNGVMLCRETIRQVIELAGKNQTELMRQAVATVVSRTGDDLRVGWLRPERCEVGTLLYCPTSASKDSSCG